MLTQDHAADTQVLNGKRCCRELGTKGLAHLIFGARSHAIKTSLMHGGLCILPAHISLNGVTVRWGMFGKMRKISCSMLARASDGAKEASELEKTEEGC